MTVVNTVISVCVFLNQERTIANVFGGERVKFLGPTFLVYDLILKDANLMLDYKFNTSFLFLCYYKLSKYQNMTKNDEKPISI